jgi:hypothetical protein
MQKRIQMQALIMDTSLDSHNHLLVPFSTYLIFL